MNLFSKLFAPMRTDDLDCDCPPAEPRGVLTDWGDLTEPTENQRDWLERKNILKFRERFWSRFTRCLYAGAAITSMVWFGMYVYPIITAFVAKH